MYVDVAVPIPAEKTFSYAVPPALTAQAVPGKRVLVPFGRRHLTGYIVARTAAGGVEQTKDIAAILDEEPLFHEDDLRFYRWAAGYYIYPLGKMLAEVLPTGGLGRSGRPALLPRRERCVSLAPDAAGVRGARLTAKQAALLELIAARGEMPVSRLREECGKTYSAAALRSLAHRQIVCIREREVFRAPDRAGGEAWQGGLTLNEDQRRAVGIIVRSLGAEGFAPMLLHGVTGSGKTEVYIQAAREALARGGGVIVLVPEIALTPQLLSRFRGRFDGERLAVLHSGVARSVRYDQWRLIARGEIRIAVGARSALFAPVRNLKLIIVDEEHDTSYKQDERLPYHARDLAVMKGKLTGAAVLLGSATPSMQTYFNATGKKYGYISLPRRVEDRSLPRVEIVDMKGEKDGHEAGGPLPVLSRVLQAALAETVAAGRQALLLLNRRGFHTLTLCLACGATFRCRNCTLALTHHASEDVMKCHRCDFAMPVPTVCPQCGSRRIGSYGVGTEKLEEEVARLLPAARVARMDSDTTARKGAYERLLRAVGQREIDVLVGTQMIAKGHDFPDITLVGVVSADAALNLPDFRAAEKTFQLLTQVSGRGGRGEAPGSVIVQTFNPGHYALRCAERHDYHRFYEQEYAQREALSFPPFSRLVHLLLSGRTAEEGHRCAAKLGALARELVAAEKRYAAVDVTGPAAAPIAKIRGRYRWQLLLKGRRTGELNALAREILARAAADGMTVKVDVDPVNFL